MTTSLCGRRSGVTLAELLVVIVILGIVASIAIQSFATLSSTADGERRAAIERQLLSARSTALRRRRPVFVRVDDGVEVLSATALPDGSVVGDSALLRDRLNGTRLSVVGGQD